ncbi:unnamed protein product [Caenorhabditis auriculariae]|uniref:C-CAP/cofactor C-like domain-containing protein n=1 Tax=Caenorhabditis auriculariae TaxID=2777116 RepID=A0A8S1GW38_9PELO|nr:unnamed protein product [Caenorhabditis auriculariae]
MADSTRVSEAELQRRESYIRAHRRHQNVADPFTWTYPWKGAGAMFGISMIAALLHNRWNKKPYYYALYPRLVLVGGVTAIGYAMGCLRQRHHQTREAVIQHYTQLHPEDFDHFNDRNGRAFSQIMLPWYPKRAQYTKRQKFLQRLNIMEVVDEDKIAERREKLMMRLGQRNENKHKSIASEAKAHESEVDRVLSSVQRNISAGIIDEKEIAVLEQEISMSEGSRRSKIIQEVLEKVRLFRVAKQNERRVGFSFNKNNSSRRSAQPNKDPELKTTVCEIPETDPAATNTNVVENLSDCQKLLVGNDGADVALKNIQRCRLEFSFKASAIHIRNVKDSTLIFMPCERSILMHDCHNVVLYAAAQQIRVHTSQKLEMHVVVRGAVVLEDCTDLKFSPYRVLSKKGVEIEAEDNGEWRRPRDFDWLASGQSPHWSVVSETDWSTERMLL